MAVFQFNNYSLPYHFEMAPLDFDLLLLQASKAPLGFWDEAVSLLRDAGGEKPGRILTCSWGDWSEAQGRPREFLRLLQTLGMVRVRVVACGDAVELIEEVQKLQPGIFDRTLLFPLGGPQGPDMLASIRVFCGV